MTPRIPVRTNNLDEWIRNVATVINLIVSRVDIQSGDIFEAQASPDGGHGEEGVVQPAGWFGVNDDDAGSSMAAVVIPEAVDIISTVPVPFSLEDEKPSMPLVRLIPQAADPSSPEDGDLWYNSTDGKIRARVGGVTIDLN